MSKKNENEHKITFADSGAAAHDWAMASSPEPQTPTLWAGAATLDITPAGSVFLFGYPHVPRSSTGVHDPLECDALFLRTAGGGALILACDLIYFGRDFAREVRQRAAEAAGLPVEAVMLTATHTHSGPVMTNNLSNSADSVVPPADPVYLRWLADRLVEAARVAVAAAEPAEIARAEATASGVGSNRHDPAGPTDPSVPVWLVRAIDSGRPLACLLIYAMHPTVLHEDSTLISGDFIAFTRQALRGGVLPEACPVLYLQGAAGNQSPRHMTRGNTLAEAQRIGENLARALAEACVAAVVTPVADIEARVARLEVEPRSFPAVEAAREALAAKRAHFAALQAAGAPRQEVRTAECDVFGAEKTAILAVAAADGRLAAAVAAASPAEVQLLRIGPWRLLAWPGEFFVEHGLALKAQAPEGTHLVTLANGELQGYIATPEAVRRGYYEATNAVFTVDNGPRFVERSLALIADLG
jgi:neutral ceramidase